MDTDFQYIYIVDTIMYLPNIKSLICCGLSIELKQEKLSLINIIYYWYVMSYYYGVLQVYVLENELSKVDCPSG